MKYTENFKLKKPEQTDSYNVNDFNDNMDLIEKLLTPEDISSKFVVTPDDETAGHVETVYSSVYKQGKVIIGNLSFYFGGGGELDRLFFEIPTEYYARGWAITQTVGFVESSTNPYDHSCHTVFEGGGFMVEVSNMYIKEINIAFTYMCK